jgi:hypothetical protein
MDAAAIDSAGYSGDSLRAAGYQRSLGWHLLMEHQAADGPRLGRDARPLHPRGAVRAKRGRCTSVAMPSSGVQCIHRLIALRTLGAATVAAVLAVATQVSAHLPAPLVATALVEDVKSETADIEFMDFVGNGQVIKLKPRDVLVLSYLKSCEHETITGGTVIVGVERSDVQGGKIVRAKVSCNGGKMRLSSQQASISAASVFRLQSAEIQPTLYARTPVIQIPKILANDNRTLLIERIDRPGERHELKIDEAVARGSLYDLAKINVRLTRGAIYNASFGGHRMKFEIDAKAKSGPAPVISRLLRFQ